MAVVIIPARMESQRLPGKPLASIGELPLVVRVARQAQKARRVDSVAVATDSAEIAKACDAHAVAHVMTRVEHVSGTDRVAEASATVGAAHIINVQGDEPFIDPRDLDAIAETLERGARLATLRASIADPAEYRSRQVVKVVASDSGHALYFSRAPIPYGLNDETIATRAYRHIGVYGYAADTLREWTQAPRHTLELTEGLEQLRALAMGIPITLLDAYTRGRGIDTPEDLRWARQRVQQLGDAAFP